MITILTHGYSGDETQWTNDYPFFSKNDKSNRTTNFSYDPDSMIERLRVITNGDVYFANMKSLNEFTLYKLNLTKTINGNEVSLVNNYNLAKESFEQNKQLSDSEFESIMYETTSEIITQINDISKHIIIVIGAYNSCGLNDVIYEQLNYMIDKIVYDVKCLNNGILPKINLISHSRGGITNLQYTMDYPDLVDSICTLGSPFLGSHLGQSEKILNSLSYTSTDPNDGVFDIINEDVYNGYKNRWNKYYNELYEDINFHAIGGYSSIDFLNYMLLNDDFMADYDMEWLPAVFTYLNSNRPLESLLVSLGKLTHFLPIEEDPLL